METETNTIEIDLPEAVPEEKPKRTRRLKSEPPPLPKTPKARPLPPKTLIAQVPDDTPTEVLEELETQLKQFAIDLNMETSEIRKMRPDIGGKPKKYATPEDEKEHYKQYFKDYYTEKLAKTGTCQYCNKEFKTYTSISRHVKRSKHCQAMRAQKDAILNELANNVPEAQQEISQ
jgi:hypothetical protein